MQSPVRCIFLFIFCFAFSVLHAQDQKNGKCSIVNKDGTISKGRKRNGLKQGEWITRDSNQKIILRQHFVAGKKEGQSISFSPAGDTLTIEHFHLDSLNGPWEFRNPALQMKVTVEFRSHKQEGWLISSWTDPSNDRHLDSTFYVNGKREGRATQYVNGILTRETPCRSGKVHGTVRMYSPKTGELTKEYHMKNDTVHGLATDYYNGKIEEERYWTNGKYDRYYRGYFRNSDSVKLSTVYRGPDVRQYSESYGAPGVLKTKSWYDSRDRIDSLYELDSAGRVRLREYYRYGYFMFWDSTYEKRSFYFHANGTLEHNEIHQGYYPVGGWQYFNEAGVKTKELDYIDGSNYMRYRAFYSNGKTKLYATLCSGMYYDSLIVYDRTGAELKPGTPEYRAVFSEVESGEQRFRFTHPSTENAFILDRHEWVECRPPYDSIYTAVEASAKFPGDTAKAWIQHNLKYPAIAKEQGREGTVYVRFVVEKDGRVTNATLAKGSHPTIDKEALRVVASMPAWIPATRYGRAVRSEVLLPVKFSLN